MKNVYDIRYEKNLIYILPSEPDSLSSFGCDERYTNTVIIVYLYYLDTVSVYWSYLDGIPKEIHVCVISSREEVLKEVRRHMEISGRTAVQ